MTCSIHDREAGLGHLRLVKAPLTTQCSVVGHVVRSDRCPTGNRVRDDLQLTGQPHGVLVDDGDAHDLLERGHGLPHGIISNTRSDVHDAHVVEIKDVRGTVPQHPVPALPSPVCLVGFQAVRQRRGVVASGLLAGGRAAVREDVLHGGRDPDTDLGAAQTSCSHNGSSPAIQPRARPP